MIDFLLVDISLDQSPISLVRKGSMALLSSNELRIPLVRTLLDTLLALLVLIPLTGSVLTDFFDDAAIDS